VQLWRITTRRYADSAFSGIGNKRVGSRWVPPGLLAVYTSEHPATAVVETLVHLDPHHLAHNHVLIRAELPDDLPFDEVRADSLPADWRTRFEDGELQQVGRDWVARGECALLIVPSAVVPQARNIILNPLHGDMAEMQIHPPEPFDFDGRLFKAL